MEISAMMHMPNDIITEILPWLPAKSLLRFRWVCKYWFDLIRESSFVKKHLFRSNNNCGSRLRALDYSKLSITNKSDNFTQCYIDYTTGVFSRQVLTVPCPFIRTPRSLCQIFGPCHGLILSACSTTVDIAKLCILNPCTKEYKEIPSAPPVPDHLYHAFCYGFGYDRTTDDYKVIRVAYYFTSFLQVYTLRTNSWRSIGFIPYRLLPHPFSTGLLDGVSVNGALYWKNYSKEKIVCFDFGKEMYETITNQPVCFHDNLKNGKLGMFEGSLSVILCIDDPITALNYAEMWVLKDNYCVNNNESSWTKLFRTKLSLACSFKYLKPLRFIKSGEIVLMNKWGSLLLYDPKNPTTLVPLKRTWGKEEHCTFDEVDSLNIVYIESLVSLNSGTYTN